MGSGAASQHGECKPPAPQRVVGLGDRQTTPARYVKPSRYRKELICAGPAENPMGSWFCTSPTRDMACFGYCKIYRTVFFFCWSWAPLGLQRGESRVTRASARKSLVKGERFVRSALTPTIWSTASEFYFYMSLPGTRVMSVFFTRFNVAMLSHFEQVDDGYIIASAGSTVIVYVPATDETRVWFSAGADFQHVSFFEIYVFTLTGTRIFNQAAFLRLLLDHGMLRKKFYRSVVLIFFFSWGCSPKNIVVR